MAILESFDGQVLHRVESEQGIVEIHLTESAAIRFADQLIELGDPDLEQVGHAILGVMP